MNPDRILLIQLRRVGDVIFTLPVPAALQKAFPKAKIDFLVEKPSDQLVRLNPCIHETLVYDKRRPGYWIQQIRSRKYDWVIDFHSNGRTLMMSFLSGAKVRAGFDGPFSRRLAYNRMARHSSGKYIVEQKLDLLKVLGVNADRWSWDLDLPDEEKHRAEKFLKSEGALLPGRKLIGIAPATRRITRAWVNERFAEVTNQLIEDGHDVLFLWGGNEMDVINDILKNVRRNPGRGRIIVPPDTSLIQLAALIQKCSLVLAVDNGPKNIAVALKVPTVSLNGPTNPASFNPHDDPAHVFVRDEKLFCIGCELNACPYRHECMEYITADQVLKKIQGLFSVSAGKVMDKAV